MGIREDWIRETLDAELLEAAERGDELGPYPWAFTREGPVVWVLLRPRRGNFAGLALLLRLDASNYQDQGLVGTFHDPDNPADGDLKWWPNDNGQAFKDRATSAGGPWICLGGFRTYHSAPGNHGGYRKEDWTIARVLVTIMHIVEVRAQRRV